MLADFHLNVNFVISAEECSLCANAEWCTVDEGLHTEWTSKPVSY
jgi:hypothetical protein